MSEYKRDALVAMLQYSDVDVRLDPRKVGVIVPPALRRETNLTLRLGLDMPVPIPDLAIDENRVRGTLSFNRRPYYCYVPWTAVFALVPVDDAGANLVWPKDVPQELRRAAVRERRPALRLIQGGKS
jgi:hypothetical protein